MVAHSVSNCDNDRNLVDNDFNMKSSQNSNGYYVVAFIINIHLAVSTDINCITAGDDHLRE